MADIIKLVPAQHVDPDVEAAHAATMQFLREIVERAQQEKSTLALVIMLNADGSVTDGWSAGGMIRPYTVIGALEELKLRFRDKNIEQR